MGEFVAGVKKKCTSCGIEKDTAYFYRHRASKYGVRAMCRSCSNAKGRERSERTPQEVKDRYNIQRAKRRATDVIAKLGSLCSWSKSRAKKSGIGHSVTKQDLIELYEAQDGKCALTGREFNLEPYHMNGISLDRENNSEGYHVGNIQLVTKAANMAKAELTKGELISLCEDIINVNGGRHSAR